MLSYIQFITSFTYMYDIGMCMYVAVSCISTCHYTCYSYAPPCRYPCVIRSAAKNIKTKKKQCQLRLHRSYYTLHRYTPYSIKG